MRSNYIRDGGAETRQMFREIAKEEIRKQKAEFCPKCEEQIQAHCIALICHTLHTMYGFGAKRIADVIQGARGVDMYTVNVEHKKRRCLGGMAPRKNGDRAGAAEKGVNAYARN